MAEGQRVLSRISRVVLPLDGSPASTPAVDASLEIADQFGARLQLLHIPASDSPPPAQRGAFVGPWYLDAPHHEWPAWSDEFLRRFGPGERAAGERVEFHVAPGEPAEEILGFAKERGADLIAIAWRQNLGQGRAEVVKRLLAKSECPLMFVPAPGQEPAQ